MNVQEMNMDEPELFKPAEDLKHLQLLEELEKDPHISQRKLSNKFGISLGVTNAFIKNMTKKGWLVVKGINHKRIGYFLTPKGIKEKTKLAYHLMENAISRYVEIKDRVAKKMVSLNTYGIKKIIFYGVGEEMEIAYITLQGVDIKLVGIIDDNPDIIGKKIFGFNVISIENFSKMSNNVCDAVLITSIKSKAIEMKKRAKKVFGPVGIKVESLRDDE